MPASNSPICSREPASTAWRLEAKQPATKISPRSARSPSAAGPAPAGSGFLPSTSSDPDGMPPSGSLCFYALRRGENSLTNTCRGKSNALPRLAEWTIGSSRVACKAWSGNVRGSRFRCSISSSPCSPAWSQIDRTIARLLNASNREQDLHIRPLPREHRRQLCIASSLRSWQ